MSRPPNMNGWRQAPVSLIVLGSVLFGCADDATTDANSTAAAMTTTTTSTAIDDQFCEAMRELVVLLEPTDESSPIQTRATFEAAAAWFDQADRTAPPEIAEDVAAYVDAFERYTVALEAIGYDLNVMFSTPDGEQLAIDTSHTLTPSIFEHLTDDCGISFGGEPRQPSATGETSTGPGND